MKKIKKSILSIISLLAVAMVCFTACNSGNGTVQVNEDTKTTTADTEKNDGIKVVTTIFPEYDWVKAILGDNAGNAELTLLLNKGVDLHSYQPTAEDIMKISTCDMFVYVGGESDGWVDDALSEAVNKDMKVINLMELMGDKAKAEELKEGMQETEHDHEHGEEGEEHEHDEAAEGEEHEHEEEPEYDEHVWLSLDNAKIICEELKNSLCEIDSKNADSYKANCEAYISELDALDKKFTELANGAENKTLIFGDRFPFRYFTDEYGLDYYAAFVGCSAETEASFETVAFLSSKIDELGSKTVYTIESSDGKIAEAIINNTKDKDMKTAVLDSMQSVTAKDIESGTTYLSVMEKNYEVLKESLK